MADSIEFDATVQDSGDEVIVNKDLQEQVSNDSDLESLDSFIDDNKKEENNISFYQHFDNVDKPIDETLSEEYDKSIVDMENFNEFSNFCETSEEEGEVDDFKDSEKRIQKFEDILFLLPPDDENSSV